MAQVDFSSATIEVYNSSTKPMDIYSIGLYPASFFSTTQGAGTVATISTQNIVESSPSLMSVTYVGTFTASGTDFIIAYNGSYYWKVSNVSFASGDTFSFAVDVAITVS